MKEIRLDSTCGLNDGHAHRTSMPLQTQPFHKTIRRSEDDIDVWFMKIECENINLIPLGQDHFSASGAETNSTKIAPSCEADSH
jgi:hypothetical protein